MTTTTQAPPWSTKAKAAPATIRREPAASPESDEEGLLSIARHLLRNDHADSTHREKAMRRSPALRRYLSGVNLDDSDWIWDPLFWDMTDNFSMWPPHHLGLRTG